MRARSPKSRSRRRRPRSPRTAFALGAPNWVDAAEDLPLLYGFSPGSCAGTDPANLSSPRQDVANFLLVRGAYAVLGNGWLGCSRSFEYPAELFDADYGEPLGLCRETAPGSEVFVREWSRATVQMDCRTWTPSFHMREERGAEDGGVEEQY